MKIKIFILLLFSFFSLFSQKKAYYKVDNMALDSLSFTQKLESYKKAMADSMVFYDTKVKYSYSNQDSVIFKCTVNKHFFADRNYFIQFLRKKELEGKKLGITKFTTIKDEEIDLDSIKSKKILLFFFDSSCLPAFDQIKYLDSLQKVVKDLEIISFTREPKKSARMVARQQKVKHQVVYAADPLFDWLNFKIIPLIVLLDESKKIRVINYGFDNVGTLEKKKLYITTTISEEMMNFLQIKSNIIFKVRKE